MSQQGGISRRSLVQGAAWSVPVIAAAAAAPLAAASTTGPGPALVMRAGCVTDDDGAYYGAGFEIQNVGDVPFIGHFNVQEFLDIGVEIAIDQIPYAFGRSIHQFTLGTISPLGWNFPGFGRRGNRSVNFRGELLPGQRVGFGHRVAWTQDSSLTQPDGWLAHLNNWLIVRSVTPDDGIPVTGMAVDSTAEFLWSDGVTCQL